MRRLRRRLGSFRDSRTDTVIVAPTPFKLDLRQFEPRLVFNQDYQSGSSSYSIPKSDPTSDVQPKMFKVWLLQFRLDEARASAVELSAQRWPDWF